MVLRTSDGGGERKLQLCKYRRFDFDATPPYHCNGSVERGNLVVWDGQHRVHHSTWLCQLHRDFAGRAATFLPSLVDRERGKWHGQSGGGSW
jgi:hypothetical protein